MQAQNSLCNIWCLTQRKSMALQHTSDGVLPRFANFSTCHVMVPARHAWQSARFSRRHLHFCVNIRPASRKPRRVFRSRRAVQLATLARKCRFFFTHIRYLGLIISAEGITQDPTKLEAIVNYPEPRSTKDCRRFLGLANFCRRHCQSWAHHSEDLIKLTRKNAKFEWGQAQREAFYKLKLSLVQHPTLRHPDFSRPFVLVTDASSIAIGASLQQLDAEGDTYIVAYFSRTLNAAQRRWSSYDLEFYAIVASCQQFQDYLRDAKFTIISDCASLMTRPH